MSKQPFCPHNNPLNLELTFIFRDLVDLHNDGPIWNYFCGKAVLTDGWYPKDADSTALAHLVLDTSHDDKQAAMAMMLQYLTPDGFPMV